MPTYALNMSAYFAYIPIHIYILLRQYTYTCLRPLYAIYMLTYVYAHIHPI